MHVYVNIFKRCSSAVTCVNKVQAAILVFVSSILWTTVHGECPGNVKLQASNCFDVYHTHLLNLKQSDKTLFSGVDAEIIRAFCSSYTEALKCIENLKSQCPAKTSTILQSVTIGLEGAEDELKQLCRDDVIYEVYARHQTCYSKAGNNSEKCFERIMRTSVRLMKRIDQRPIEMLCGDIRELLICIGTNIEKRCGKEAASVVPSLVKPMVRRSTQCDYRLVSSTVKSVTKSPGSGDKSQNDQYVSGDNGTESLRSSVLQLLTFLFILHSFLMT